MKNKILAVLLTALMLTLSFTGCTDSKKDDDSLNIVTTIFAPYDFCRSLTAGIEDTKLSMLLKPGMESHHFEPTPQDILTVQNADVFIYVGGESDQWVNTILQSVDTSNMEVLTLIDCVDLLTEEHTKGVSHSDHHHDDEYDEHVWTSPKNAMKIADSISDTLCKAAPQYEQAISKNNTDYQAQLTKLDAAFTELFSKPDQKEIIMGDRFPFLYFAKAYDVSYYAAFPGCAAEAEPNAKTMAFLIDKIKTDNIPVVFYMELSDQQIADALCEATGAKKLQLHACHNITDDDFKAGKTYLSLMQQNLNNLQEALK